MALIMTVTDSVHIERENRFNVRRNTCFWETLTANKIYSNPRTSKVEIDISVVMKPAQYAARQSFYEG